MFFFLNKQNKTIAVVVYDIIIYDILAINRRKIVIARQSAHWLCVQVRSLEAANRNLELQIKQYYETKAPGISRDLTGYFATITDLRCQVRVTSVSA